MMDHSKLVSQCVKYFNFLVGVLMLVVLSLNIDSIFHNRHHLNIIKQQQQQQLIDLSQVEKCETCRQDAMSIITRFNVEGCLLALFLAGFSFLFAFRTELFARNYQWFIPVIF